MRKLIVLIIFLMIISLGIGFYNWKHPIQKMVEAPAFERKIQNESEALSFTDALLKQGRAEDAMRIIGSYESSMSDTNPKGKQWIKYLIEASTQLQNSYQLSLLWHHFPNSFAEDEAGSIALAKYMLLNNMLEQFYQLRKTWQAKARLKDEWFLLDADALTVESKHTEAIKLLSSRQLQGTQEALRLLRLAIQEVSINDAKKAWDYLNQAMKIDPKSASVRLYRGRFLEAVGKPENALVEYLIVVQENPKIISFKDQLADYFIRYARYEEALSILQDCLAPPSTDILWIKTYFWSKVTAPITFEWKNIPIPQGPSTPLIKYLIDLPKGVFWDESSFKKLANGNTYLNHVQPTLWLRVIQFLVEKNENSAKEVLNASTFTNQSVYPALEKALLQVLNYRLSKSLKVYKSITKYEVAEDNNKKKDEEKTFFALLNEAAENGSNLSPSLTVLLNSEEAFAGVFLAANWNESAVALHRLDTYPDQFPLWMAINMGRALLQVKGSDEALAFLNKQTRKDTLELLKGQILLSIKRTDEAEKILLGIKNNKDETGRSATWLLSEIYLESGDAKKAEQMLNSRKDLVEETRGQEMSARIALKNKQTSQAENIYNNIKDKSAEAKSYFARKAFNDKDYDTAGELTMELLLQTPTNSLLLKNMEDILIQQNELKSHKK